MARKLPLPVGTKVIAVRNVGHVLKGAAGIITGTATELFYLWSRSIYLCTFAGNIKLAVRPKDIDDQDHRYSLEALQNPDFVREILLKGSRSHP